MSVFEEYVSGNTKITLNSGTEIDVIPLVWGKELKIYNILTKAFSKLDFETGEDGLPILNSASTQSFLVNFANEITQIASIVLGKDAKWIESNLNSSDIVDFILPLSLGIYGKINKGMTAAVTDLSEEMTQEVEG